MKRNYYFLLIGSLLLTNVGMIIAQTRAKDDEVVVPKSYQAITLPPSERLQAALESSVREVIADYKDGILKPEEVAATVIDLRDPNNLTSASVRGEERIYPASVVKMFYMVALERQMEDGKIITTPELERGLRDMIVDSSNEATQYVLDVITNTSSGAELPKKEFEAWQFKRNRVNRFYSAMGYRNINTNQKTFCEDAYGIERQSRNFPTDAANRNKLTTNATARLLAEIVLGKTNTPERSNRMLALMKRDPFIKTTDLDRQDNGFTGKLFLDRKMTDVKLWSKAGWTSSTRHDAAYFETADGTKMVTVIFTENHAADRELIPSIIGKFLDEIKAVN